MGQVAQPAPKDQGPHSGIKPVVLAFILTTRALWSMRVPVYVLALLNSSLPDLVFPVLKR